MSCSVVEIGKRIAELRDGRKLTQAQLARDLNVSRGVVSKWEAGLRDLKTDHTVALADYFGVTCDYILRGVHAEQLDIHKSIGISQEAIKMLSDIREHVSHLIPYFDRLCSGHLLLTLQEMHRYKELEKAVFKMQSYSTDTRRLCPDIRVSIVALNENDGNLCIEQSVEEASLEQLKISSTVEHIMHTQNFEDLLELMMMKVQAVCDEWISSALTKEGD